MAGRPQNNSAYILRDRVTILAAKRGLGGFRDKEFNDVIEILPYTTDPCFHGNENVGILHIALHCIHEKTAPLDNVR